MKKFNSLIFFLFFLFFDTVLAYYADIQIDVTKEGLVSVEGSTNHPGLNIISSPDYTSKDGKYWVFNLTLSDVFDSYIYELNLPKGSEVNYFKTPKLSRIKEDEGKITLIGTGNNQHFLVVVQYQIHPDAKNYAFLIVAILLLAFVFLVLRLKNRVPSKLNYNPESLTERQNQIINLLKKSKKPLTQAKLEDLTGLPKSSLSRNIDSLVKRGIIVKEKKGISNIIYLK